MTPAGYPVPMSTEPADPPGAPTRSRRSRSQRQVEQSTENRRILVHNAVEFFARYGYTKTTLQAIAERVGLTRTGLLHHFRSKEGLFVEAIEEGRQWAERQARHPAGSGGALSGIRAMNRFLGGADDAVHVRFVQTLQAEALHDDASEHVSRYARARLSQVRAHAMGCLEQAQAQGEIGDVDIPAMATMVAATVNGLQMQRLLDPSVDTARALDALADVLAATAPADRAVQTVSQVPDNHQVVW